MSDGTVPDTNATLVALSGPTLASWRFASIAAVHGGGGSLQVASPLAGFVTPELDARAAVRCWAAARTALAHLDVAVVMVATAAGVLDASWDDNVHDVQRALASLQFYGAGAPALAELFDDSDRSDATRALVHGRLADPRVQAVVDKRGVTVPGEPRLSGSPATVLDEPLLRVWETKSTADAQAISWRLGTAEDRRAVRVFVLQGDRALAPLCLRWMFTPERAVTLARLWRAWRDRHGFEVAFLGSASLEAFVPRRPSTIADLHVLLEEQLAFCPRFSRFANPVAAVLANALDHHWRFVWD